MYVCFLIFQDFVISIIFVIAWFSAAIACAASVTGIKNTTDINKIIGKIPQCAGSCKATLDGNYATLDISAVCILLFCIT